MVADPADAIDQPRSTSIDGPKLKITAKPILNRPQIRPATITAKAALRSRRTAAVDAAGADLAAVHEQGDVAALADAVSVVGELHRDLVVTGVERAVRGDGGGADAGEVVAVAQLTFVGVDRPASGLAALGDDHAVQVAVGGSGDVRGDGVGGVLDVDHAVLAEPSGAGIEGLAGPLDQGGSAGELGDEPGAA